MMSLADGQLELYSGNDDQVLPILSLGGLGVISVLSNVAPKFTHDMVMKYFDGDTKGATEDQLKALPLINALFSEVNPIPVKTAMNLMGMNVGAASYATLRDGRRHKGSSCKRDREIRP